MENNEKITSKSEFLKFIKYLEKSFKPWYNKNVNRSLYLWYVFQFLSILCGFASAIIAAFSDAEFFIYMGKFLLIAIPIIGSLAATVILQFRIYDLWQLRESGRLVVEKMISEGYRIYASNKNELEYAEIHKFFIEKIYELEEEQKSKFFKLSKSNSVLKFDLNK